MRVLFMGTPEFSLFSLKALHASRHTVIGVVTQPDKPKGRGYELQPPPVKIYAQSEDIPVFQPETLRNDAFLEPLKALDPDVIVVAAYGKILPSYVLRYPRFGCVNIHGSLLPEYRGAAPMQRAILDGKPFTGITTMHMDEGLDTGKMLLKREVPILARDNFETLHDKLGPVGAELLLETLDGLEAGTIEPQEQDESKATYAAKIEKADCEIRWSLDAATLHNRVRGLSPFPLAFTHLPDGKLLKIVSAEPGPDMKDVPGRVVSLDGGIVVACGEGSLRLLGVLPEGKGRMRAQDFVNGRKISIGDCLT